MSQQNWGPGQGQQAPQNTWNQAQPPSGQPAGGQAWGQPQGAPQGGASPQAWGQAAPPAADSSAYGQTPGTGGGWNGNPAGQSGPGSGGPTASSELKKLESDALMWLVVVLAGFFFGFGWATGPAGWYFGSEIRKKYRSMGMEPAGNANLAYFSGIASTVLYYGTILFVLALFVIIPMIFVGAVITGAAVQ